MIMGGSRIAVRTAQYVPDYMQVKIVENNLPRCKPPYGTAGRQNHDYKRRRARHGLTGGRRAGQHRRRCGPHRKLRDEHPCLPRRQNG